MTVIDLPWPAKVLHPNARVHWRRKADATRKARGDAILCALAANATRIDAEAVLASVIFSPPDNRRRDLDGMLSSVKAYFDSIAEVIGIDDHKWEIAIEKALPVKGGNVRITITPIKEQSA
jgi:crossover junction endodeoxyribonuclease RusA